MGGSEGQWSGHSRVPPMGWDSAALIACSLLWVHPGIWVHDGQLGEKRESAERQMNRSWECF